MMRREEGAVIGHRYEHEFGLAQEFKKLDLDQARIRTRTRLGAAVSSHEEEAVEFSELEAFSAVVHVNWQKIQGCNIYQYVIFLLKSRISPENEPEYHAFLAICCGHVYSARSR